MNYCIIDIYIYQSLYESRLSKEVEGSSSLASTGKGFLKFEDDAKKKKEKASITKTKDIKTIKKVRSKVRGDSHIRFPPKHMSVEMHDMLMI